MVRKKQPTYAVVGIGTSAGGLRPLAELLSNLSENLDACFVIAQHLEPKSEKLALKNLQLKSTIPVVLAKQGQSLEHGKAYFIPPHSLVEIKKNKFVITKSSSKEAIVNPIDHVFSSIADSYGQNAMGILLSGSGSDGSIGLKYISEKGGMTLVQEPQTAEYPSMPEYAIGLGVVDRSLEVSKIPKYLTDYVDYLKAVDTNTQNRISKSISEHLPAICDILQQVTFHDFKHYKSSTLVRRIQRRLQVTQSTSVEHYIEKLKSDQNEIDVLFKEILINVTSFFRDPQAFEALKTEAIDKLVQRDNPSEKIRVWVAGCSTGEEVYTLAMLLVEAAEKKSRKPEVQIIATDIDEHALNVARKGSYPLAIADQVSKERLEKFFLHKGGKYTVKKEIREICLFSSHNLINDPPFSQIDLISCRNVMIYFGSHLQQKLIPVFHYSLKPNGYLFLGNSETVTGHSELFKVINAKERIAQRKATAVRTSTHYPAPFKKTYSLQAQETPQNTESDLHLVGQRIILDEFTPNYAIVNEDQEILSLSSGMNKYINHSDGAFQTVLSKLIVPELRISLRSTFKDAQKIKRKIQHAPTTVRIEGNLRKIAITVQPMPQLGTDDELYMIVFSDFGPGIETETLQHGKTADYAIVEQLEKELADVRSDLDKTVQDLEASNEELKSSNEELLSMNEELQSANEELETSREEVQTSNEILQKSHVDLENLLHSSQIATIFLDEQLQIKSFTPEVTQVYNILDRDIGRPIEHITHKALQTQSFADLKNNNLEAVDTELTLADGQTYLRRIHPYKTKTGETKGWVITFSNITEIRKKEGIYHTLADNLPAMVWTLKPNGELVFMNREGQRYTGITPNKTGQLDRLNLIHPDQRKFIEDEWKRASETGEYFEHDIQFRSKDGTYRWFHLKVTPVKISTGQIIKWMALAFDIHDKQMEAKNILREKSLIETERQNFRNLFRQTPEMVCILKGPEHLFEFVNDAHIRALGFDATGMTVREAQPESVEVHGILDEVYRTGVTAELKEIPVTLTNRLRYFDLTYAARKNEYGEIDGIMILGMEITDQVLMRRQIKKNEEQLSMAVGVSKIGFYDWDIKNDVFQLSDQFYKDWDIDPNLKGLTLTYLLSLVVPEDIKKTEALINEAIASKKDYIAQYRVIRRDKSIVWIEARGSVLYDENGNPERFFGTSQDITSRKETEQEILESRIKAEAASNAKTSFLANMSHEIRTPLGAILGFANLLKEPEITPDKHSEYLTIIDRNGQALTKIIDDILDLSKVEAGRLELERIDFRVEDLLKSVLDIFQETARRKDVHLYLNMSKEVPHTMISDPARIRQILVNLVGNAVKFTKKGEIELQVETEEDNGKISFLKFRVRDTGVGMTSEQQERLFNAFSQADNSTTRKYGGSGLGLALSRRLARALGGDVVVEKSIPGKGATFVATVEADKSNTTIEPTQLSKDESIKKTTDKVRILVAEDSPDNQFLIKHILLKEGFHIDLANNGEEAIDMIKKNSYDVVVMDMQMPILDGYNATRVLRSENFKKPIIALTAHAMVEEKNRIIEAGCDLHLTKPLDRKLLIQSIYNLVKK